MTDEDKTPPLSLKKVFSCCLPIPSAAATPPFHARGAAAPLPALPHSRRELHPLSPPAVCHPPHAVTFRRPWGQFPSRPRLGGPHLHLPPPWVPPSPTSPFPPPPAPTRTECHRHAWAFAAATSECHLGAPSSPPPPPPPPAAPRHPHVVEAGQGLAVLAPPAQQRPLGHEAGEGAGRHGVLRRRHGRARRRRCRRLATAAGQRLDFRRGAKPRPGGDVAVARPASFPTPRRRIPRCRRRRTPPPRPPLDPGTSVPGAASPGRDGGPAVPFTASPHKHGGTGVGWSEVRCK